MGVDSLSAAKLDNLVDFLATLVTYYPLRYI